MENTLVIVNNSGLHARPASLLVKEAGRYECNLTLTKQEKTVDLKSILGIMSLAVSAGETVVIRADGPDEEEALCQLSALIEGGLGESKDG